MTKKELIDECKKIYLKTRNTNVRDNLISEKIEKEFCFLADRDKNDQEIRVYQILSAYFISIGKFDEIVEEIKKTHIFKQPSYHLLVLIAYLEDMWMSGIHEDTYQLLEKFNETDKSRQCVIEILKAWRYEFADQLKYRDCLERAFEFDQTVPQVCISLGRHLINNSYPERGKRLLQFGLSNTKQVLLSGENQLKELDPEAFIDCYIKVYYCPESEYERCRADLLR